MARSNRERTEATRQALLDAARSLFVERGYGETSTPDVCAAAGKDWEEVLRQQAREMKLRSELGLSMPGAAPKREPIEDPADV